MTTGRRAGDPSPDREDPRPRLARLWGAPAARDTARYGGYVVRGVDDGWEVRHGVGSLAWWPRLRFEAERFDTQQSAVDYAISQADAAGTGARWYGRDGRLMGRKPRGGSRPFLWFGLRGRALDGRDG